MTNFKLSIIGALMLLGTVFAQEETVVRHELLYFKTTEDIILGLGTPVEVKVLSDSMAAFIYNIDNRAETMWVVFGYFTVWYPKYSGWAGVFPADVPVVVNISYYPKLPE